MQPLRVGLIGAGANTRLRHLPGLQAIEQVQVITVANRSRASAERVAREFNIPRVYDRWQQVIDDPQIDAVCIGTWPYLHAAATCAALAAGKHVLCEARMAMNLHEARRMLSASQVSDRVAMLVPSPFGFKGDRLMRELVESLLGEPRELYVRGLAATFADERAPLHWRQRRDLSGVNVLTLGILYETLSRWFGPAESVVAQSALFTASRPDPDGGDRKPVEVPDSVSVLARMTSGAQAVFQFSGCAHHAGGARIEAYGSRGTIVYDLERDEIRASASSDGALAIREIPPESAGAWQVEEDFVAAIRHGRPIRFTSFEDGVRYMAFTEAVLTSARTGTRQAVEAMV